MRELLVHVRTDPVWLERSRLDRAADVLVRYTVQWGLVLGSASLLRGADNRVAALPLALTGRYGNEPADRSIEVGAWLSQVVHRGGTEIAAPGYVVRELELARLNPTFLSRTCPQSQGVAMNDQHSEPLAAALHQHVEGERFLMLTSRAQDGRLVSRPMTVQELDSWTFRFIAQEEDDVIAQSEGKQVNLSFASGGTYVSLSGAGTVSRDLTRKQELWNRLNEAYAGDADDPANVILEVTAEQGEYWDTGNPVARVFGLAKAALSREAPAGEHGAVDL